MIPCDISSWEDLLYSDGHLHAGPEASQPDLAPKPAPPLAHPDCRWTLNPFAPKLNAEAASQSAPAPLSAPEAAPVPPSSPSSDDCVRQSAFSGKRCKQCEAPAFKGNYGFCSQHRTTAAAAVRHKPAASVASPELPSTLAEAPQSGSGCTDLVKPAYKQPAERQNAKRPREPSTEPQAPKQARTAVCLELALPVGRARRRGQSAVTALAVHACVRAGDVSDLEGLLHSGGACSPRSIIQ